MDKLLNLYHNVRAIYEEKYDIHFCTRMEARELKQFIDLYWKKGHILTKSKELFDWQYYDEIHERYNFAIARSKKTGEIHGIRGFIVSNMYDRRIQTPIVWGSVWKIRDDVAIKGLGVVLEGYIAEHIPTKYRCGVGISAYSSMIHEQLGEKMGKLTQYYIVDPLRKNYRLVAEPSIPTENIVLSDKAQFFDLNDADAFREHVRALESYLMPYKSVDYYIERYMNHPFYKYRIVEIVSGDKSSVFVYRKTSARNVGYIFIVDFFGNQESLVGTYGLFLELLRREQSECISFACTGINKAYMRMAGFLDRDDSNVILPVYFEPFVPENVELACHFWTSGECENPIIVKGDSDQDRPNEMWIGAEDTVGNSVMNA